MVAFHRVLSPRSALIFLAAAILLAARPATAKQTFRIHIDDQTEIVREVDEFSVVKSGGGYALLTLKPFQPEVENALIQLGEKKKLGEVPIPGEATWLAYVPAPALAVVRLSNETEIPEGTVVLSVRPNPKPLSAVDGAIEGAKALVALDHGDDARALLKEVAADPRQAGSRCRVLLALLDLQLPAAPENGEAIPSEAETTLRALLTNCSGVEADEAAQRFVRWTLDRLPQLQASGAGLAECKTVVQDAAGILNGRPGGDRLILARARLLDQEGDAEEGSRVIEQFFKQFPASPVKEEARQLQDALARRAPARGYKALGAMGPGEVRDSFGIRRVTDLAFDAKGRLVVLDGSSKPRKLVVLGLHPDTRTCAAEETHLLPKAWDPVAVTCADDGSFYLIDSDEDQLVVERPGSGSGEPPAYPTRGEGWKLRSPRRVGIDGKKEAIVFDPSSEKLYRFGTNDAQYHGAIDLEGAGLGDAVDMASAPDGKVLVATEEAFCVFDPDQGPTVIHPAKRGGTSQLEINRVGMCRWKYVYLFDEETNRLEKFRRSGDWLTTVLDCEKEGIRDPGTWAVSREGDVVLYDEKTDRFFYFVQ